MKYNYTFPEISAPVLKLGGQYKQYLQEHGYVLVDVGTNFSNVQYLELMSQFGAPLNESSAVDSVYVENGCILNLKTDIDKDISADDEPFSTNGLSMHVERAFSDISQQPNFLSLYCVEAPLQENGGQTIIYPMKDFINHFTDEELEEMKHLFVKIIGTPIISPQPLYRRDVGQNIEYISFRDPGVFGVNWEFSGESCDRYSLLAAKLKKALYDFSCISSLAWRPGYLYIFNNKRNFHARTEQHEISRRHLKRIRVI